MEELAQRAPEAHEHIRNIDPAIQEEIGKDILSLSHLGLVNVDESFDFVTVSEREDLDPEMAAPHHERVDSLMTRSAGWLRLAHEGSTDPLDADPYRRPSQELFRRAKERAVQAADEAKQSGDAITANDCLEDFLILGLLSDRRGQPSSESDVELAVSSNLAIELVDAAADLRGVIALKPGYGYSDSSRRLKSQTSLLEVASGLELSDDFQSRTPLQADTREKRLEELQFGDLATLARAAERHRDDDGAATLSIRAVDKLVSDEHYVINMDKVSETLRLAAQLCDAETRPEPHNQLLEAARRLNVVRSAGLKPYRINNSLAIPLDKALVGLVADGKLDVASALLSSSVHEITSPDNPNAHNYNLNYVLQYKADIADADKPQIADTLLRLHEAKQQQLREALTLNGAPETLIDTFINNAVSPETAIAVDPSFWESYASQPDFIKTRFEDSNGVWDLGGLSTVVRALEATGLPAEMTSSLLYEVLGRAEGLTKINALTQVLQDTQFKKILETEDFGPQLLRQIMHEGDVSVKAEQARKVLQTTSLGTYITAGGMASKQAALLLDVVMKSAEPVDKAIELSGVLDNLEFQAMLSSPLYGETLLSSVAYASDSIARTNQLIGILSGSRFEQQLKQAGRDGVDLARAVIFADEPEAKAAALSELLADEGFRILLSQAYGFRLVSDVTRSHDSLGRGKQLVQALNESGLGEQLATGNFGSQFDQLLVETVLRAETPESKAAELSTLLADSAFQQLLNQNYGTNLLTYVAEAGESLVVGQRLTRTLTETKFGEYISDNGIAAQLASSLLQSVMTSQNPEQMAATISQIFDGGGSLWHTTAELAELVVGGAFHSTGARTGRIPISLPVRGQKYYDPNAIVYASAAEMRDVLSLYGVDEAAVAEAEANDWRIAIDQLPAELQQTLLAADLYEAITLSRDVDSKHQATERNQSVDNQSVWQPGGLHHFTRHNNLAALLINGNLPGELIVDRMRSDSYPFNLDLVELDPAEASTGSYAERIHKLASYGFGDVCIHFIRAGADYRPGEEFAVEGSYGGQHRLMPGGLPSTQIGALTLKDSSALPAVTEAVLEASFFIPVFNEEGALVFSYEDYQALRQDRNYDVVMPEVVDTTFERPNSQAGSNEGAEFIVPAEHGGEEPSRYYCKFAKLGVDQHLWSELLADSIYRAVNSDLVPETRAVILEGRLARASRLARPDAQPVTDEARNAGFILDCLLGNWDATYNAANLVMSGGHALRIDTGNALFFRAQGEQKAAGDFTERVQELEFGSELTTLGNGMRQQYPGLVQEDVDQQVEDLETRLTDDVIDHLVDGVRLPLSDRTLLKSTLKARRQYILSRTHELAVAA